METDVIRFHYRGQTHEVSGQPTTRTVLQYLREPFSREVYLLETADPALVGRYCAAADAYIRDRLPLAQAPNLQQLRRQQPEQQQQLPEQLRLRRIRFQ